MTNEYFEKKMLNNLRKIKRIIQSELLLKSPIINVCWTYFHLKYHQTIRKNPKFPPERPTALHFYAFMLFCLCQDLWQTHFAWISCSVFSTVILQSSAGKVSANNFLPQTKQHETKFLNQKRYYIWIKKNTRHQ